MNCYPTCECAFVTGQALWPLQWGDGVGQMSASFTRTCCTNAGNTEVCTRLSHCALYIRSPDTACKGRKLQLSLHGLALNQRGAHTRLPATEHLCLQPSAASLLFPATSRPRALCQGSAADTTDPADALPAHSAGAGQGNPKARSPDRPQSALTAAKMAYTKRADDRKPTAPMQRCVASTMMVM